MDKYRFFLIDDSAFEMLVLERVLTMSGLAKSVNSFASAEDALHYIKQKEHELDDTVILLDLQMPAMNGFEFIEQFAFLSDDIKSKIRIYMLSSTIDSRDITAASENKYIIELLSKPINVDRLRVLLAK
jgi:CheY-like chemotaxis protein